MRHRPLARRTKRRRPRASSPSDASQYLMGAAAAVGHSMSSCTGAVGSGPRLLTPGAGQNAVAANRERSGPVVPARHVMLRHAVAGSAAASAGRSCVGETS